MDEKNEDDNKTDALIGLKLSGFGQSVTKFNERNFIFFKPNVFQHMIERQGICRIEKPKTKTVLPYQLKTLNIVWSKNSKIFGDKIYCECEECKEYGKIHKRYRKAGKKHGQSFSFNGNMTLSFVLKPIMHTGVIRLKEVHTLRDIHKSS